MPATAMFTVACNVDHCNHQAMTGEASSLKFSLSLSSSRDISIATQAHTHSHVHKWHVCMVESSNMPWPNQAGKCICLCSAASRCCKAHWLVRTYLPSAVGRPQSPAGSLMGYRLGYRYRSSSAVGAAMISKPARMRSSGSTSRAPPLSALDFSNPAQEEEQRTVSVYDHDGSTKQPSGAPPRSCFPPSPLTSLLCLHCHKAAAPFTLHYFPNTRPVTSCLREITYSVFGYFRHKSAVATDLSDPFFVHENKYAATRTGPNATGIACPVSLHASALIVFSLVLLAEYGGFLQL